MSGIFRSGSKLAPVFGGTIEEPRGQQFLVDCLDILETHGTPPLYLVLHFIFNSP
jgi:hypothetical protein